jgi:hypothetical protein
LIWSRGCPWRRWWLGELDENFIEARLSRIKQGALRIATFGVCKIGGCSRDLPSLGFRLVYRNLFVIVEFNSI